MGIIKKGFVVMLENGTDYELLFELEQTVERKLNKLKAREKVDIYNITL